VALPTSYMLIQLRIRAITHGTGFAVEYKRRMKTTVITTFISAILLFSPGCKNKEENNRIDEKNVIDAGKVPATVRDSFNLNYPEATAVTWEMAHEGDEDTYKAKFTNNGKYWKAEFGENGRKIKAKEDE
jgi:hypothetical protein